MMKFIVFDRNENREIDDCDELMKLSGQDPRMGFESVAIQDDGTPIVCDKCGNYGYLDGSRYGFRIVIESGSDD